MALRIPLVIVAGQIEQLQSGDSILVPTSTADVRALTNHEGATTVVIGMVVYIDAASGFKRAQANAVSTAVAVGLCFDTSIAPSASGNICTGGVMTATTGQWGAVITGGPSGLTAGALYYIDPATPGFITLTAPSTVGQVVAPVGLALSTTDMEIRLLTNILL